MAPSAVPLSNRSTAQDFDPECRSAKRLKTAHVQVQREFESEGLEAALPSHPLGVKPSGNAYTAVHNLKDSAGLFSKLPDEVITLILDHLSATPLINLGGTCKAFYAFTRLEDLWKALFIASPPTDFKWQGSWRSTYLGLPVAKESHVSCKNLFSDVLYRPFQCAHIPLRPYTENIPLKNRIRRLSNLSHDEYHTKWSGQPFILTVPVREWPVYQSWNAESLLEQYGNISFRAEAVDWPLKTYMSYMQNTTDESPVYLFDRSFVEYMGLAVGRDKADSVYWPPDCFGEDLFAVLGGQRPDSRWLIVGPERSGSTFHADPNGTSAWNAVLSGSKYWLMFPSSPTLPPPPGVILSEDGSEITSPLSIAEYLLTFHEIARETSGCKEGVCFAGEVIHVPAGWFHLVLNLEESIALTQNFVPRKKLADVLHFLRDTPDQVSGFKDDVSDPYGLFVERLRERYPEILEEALKELDRKFTPGKGAWQQLTKGSGEDGTANGGFSFGFGGGSDEEEIP